MTEKKKDSIYKMYKWEDKIISYSSWGDTFDSVSYARLPYEIKECVRLMAEIGTQSLEADGIKIVEIQKQECA